MDGIVKSMMRRGSYTGSSSTAPSTSKLPSNPALVRHVFDLSPKVAEELNFKSSDGKRRSRRRSLFGRRGSLGSNGTVSTSSTSSHNELYPTTTFIPQKRHYDYVIVACGCFWNPQLRFKRMDGVKRVIAGYTGGTEPNPASNDLQDHIPALLIEFNPKKVSLLEILQMWNANDDPWHSSTLQSSPSQYHVHDDGTDMVDWDERSAIYATSVEQYIQSLEFVRDLAATRPKDRLLVDVDRATVFHCAEEHHQDYLTKQMKDAKAHIEAYRNGETKSGLYTIYDY